MSNPQPTQKKKAKKYLPYKHAKLLIEALKYYKEKLGIEIWIHDFQPLYEIYSEGEWKIHYTLIDKDLNVIHVVYDKKAQHYDIRITRHTSGAIL